MAIQSAAIHCIRRFQDDKPSELSVQAQPANVNADSEALLTQLKKLFNAKPGKQYGKFHTDMSQCPLNGWLKEVFEEKITFHRASLLMMDQLKSVLDEEVLELYGHLIFVQDRREDQDQVYVFFMEPESVTRIGDDMEIDKTEVLNLSKIDFGIHIDVQAWLEPDPAKDPCYITLIRGRSTAKAGDLLSKALGFENSVDTKQETESLLQALEHYSLKEDQEKAQEYRQKAYDFCKEQQDVGETVSIDALSQIMDESQPSKFEQYVASESDLKVTAPLHPDARKLKRLVRFTGKGKGLSLSFSSDLIQTSVHYDTEKETLTISDIPNTLKKQLSHHFDTEN